MLATLLPWAISLWQDPLPHAILPTFDVSKTVSSFILLDLSNRRNSHGNVSFSSFGESTAKTFNYQIKQDEEQDPYQIPGDKVVVSTQFTNQYVVKREILIK